VVKTAVGKESLHFTWGWWLDMKLKQADKL